MTTVLSSYDHRSVRRVTSILGRLGRSPRPMRLAEISRALGVDSGTTYRILSTLVREGFVYKDAATRRYSLGYEVFQLGASGPARQTTADRAHRYITNIAIETSATAILASRQGREVFLHKKICGPYADRIPFDFDQKRYVDAHATSVGKVLLAFTPREEVAALYSDEPLRRHTAKTITSAETLAAELARVRRIGFATEQSELTNGLCGLAVPMYNPDGIVNLAVWLQYAPEQFSKLNVKLAAAKAQFALSEFIWFATGRAPQLAKSGKELLGTATPVPAPAERRARVAVAG
jgi:DNA-binding IclR family transcriptional regulator